MVSRPRSPYLEQKALLGVASAHVSAHFRALSALVVTPLQPLCSSLTGQAPACRGTPVPAAPSAWNAPPPGTDLIHMCLQMSQKPCLPTPATVSPLSSCFTCPVTLPAILYNCLSPLLWCDCARCHFDQCCLCHLDKHLADTKCSLNVC